MTGAGPGRRVRRVRRSAECAWGPSSRSWLGMVAEAMGWPGLRPGNSQVLVVRPAWPVPEQEPGEGLRDGKGRLAEVQEERT